MEGRGPRLIDRIRQAMRVKRYSLRTEKAYVHWVRRYIYFHGKRHPEELGTAGVRSLSRLSAPGGASTTIDLGLSWYRR